MILKIVDNKNLSVDFKNDEEMIRFNQYFTRDKRDAKWNKNRSSAVRFYQNNYRIKIQFWKEIKKLCIEYGFEFDFQDEIDMFCDVTFDQIKAFCEDQIKGTVYQEYDMEDTYHSIYLAVKNKFMRMNLSVSYGKSIFIYLLSKYIILNKIGTKILITTPKPQLSMQMMGEFSEVNKSNFPFSVWRGQVKIKDAPVVISNFQFLQNVKEEILSQFDVVIHDECHRTSAPTYKDIADKCPNVKMTKGITGSLLEDKSAEDFMVLANTGETLKTVSKRDLINAGRATDGIICFLVLSYLPVQIRQKLIDDRYNPSISKIKSLDWERQEIIKHEWRLKFIISFTKKVHSTSGNGIVFFKTISYGKKIAEYLRKHLPDSKIFYIDKDTKEADRKMFADYMNNHNNCIIVGSYDTTGTGVSIKNLRWGISAETFKSYVLIEQVIGRFMRLFTGKDNFVFYDIVDDGRIIVQEDGIRKTKRNYFYDWMTAKENNYKENGFKVTKQFIEQKTTNNKPKGLLD